MDSTPRQSTLLNRTTLNTSEQEDVNATKAPPPNTAKGEHCTHLAKPFEDGDDCACTDHDKRPAYQVADQVDRSEHPSTSSQRHTTRSDQIRVFRNSKPLRHEAHDLPFCYSTSDNVKTPDVNDNPDDPFSRWHSQPMGEEPFQLVAGSYLAPATEVPHATANEKKKKKND